jgi:PAS domain S-box-containing protein
VSHPHAGHAEAETSLRAQLGASDREFNEILYALNTSSIIAVTDRRGIILHVNDRFCEISQYSRDELVGQTHRIINSGRHPKEFFQEMWRVIGRGDVWKGELCNRAKDGSEYWVDTTIIPLLDDRGRPERYIAIRTEETKRHLAEEQARRRSTTARPVCPTECRCCARSTPTSSRSRDAS